MELVAQKLVILVFSAALCVTHGICVLGAQPDGDELDILRIDHATRIVGGRFLDAVDVLLPFAVDINAIRLGNLLDDERLHHLRAVQAQTAVVHCQEDCMCLIIRWRVDFQKKNFLNQPVDKIRERFSFELVREQILDVLIPVEHVLGAFVYRHVGLVFFHERLHAGASIRHIDVEAFLAECLRINHVVERGKKIFILDGFLLQVVQIDNEERERSQPLLAIDDFLH